MKKMKDREKQDSTEPSGVQAQLESTKQMRALARAVFFIHIRDYTDRIHTGTRAIGG
jgi:hypothetical protein